MIGNASGSGISSAQLESRVGAIGETGELFITDSDSYSKGISDSTPTIIDGINQSINTGLVAISGASGTITINKAGIYQAVVSISFSLNGGAKIEGLIFENGVQVERGRFERDIANVNDVGSAMMSALFKVQSEDLPIVLDARLLSDTSSRTASIQHMDFQVHGVGAV